MHVPLAGIDRGRRFVIADYEIVERASIAVHSCMATTPLRTITADAAEKVIPFVTEWFGLHEAKRKLPI